MKRETSDLKQAMDHLEILSADINSGRLTEPRHQRRLQSLLAKRHYVGSSELVGEWMDDAAPTES